MSNQFKITRGLVADGAAAAARSTIASTTAAHLVLEQRVARMAWALTGPSAHVQPSQSETQKFLTAAHSDGKSCICPRSSGPHLDRIYRCRSCIGSRPWPPNRSRPQPSGWAFDIAQLRPTCSKPCGSEKRTFLHLSFWISWNEAGQWTHRTRFGNP